jgi:ribulose-5-phosphate 4-epimerase/fuculose-1-phosphate aldolase
VSASALRAEIAEIGRRLYAKGLIAGNEGNFSARDGDRLYVTPGGTCKGFLAPGDVVTTDLEGQYARIALVARLLGSSNELSAEAVSALEALRVPAGYPLPPGARSGPTRP